MNEPHEIAAWCREKLLGVFRCGYNEAASGTPKEAVLIQFDIYAAEINADPKQLEARPEQSGSANNMKGNLYGK